MKERDLKSLVPFDLFRKFIILIQDLFLQILAFHDF